MATRLYASGKAGAGGGSVGAVNNASGMTMTSGGRAGRDDGAFVVGVGDLVAHHGAGMSSTRSGLVRRVLASSEAGSCTARVKRARSSGVSAAHILSAEELSTKVQYPRRAQSRLDRVRTDQGRYLPSAAPVHHLPRHRRRSPC